MRKTFVAFVAAAAMALPFSAQAVTLADVIPGQPALADDGTELFVITDTSGFNDDVNAVLFIEFASFADTNISFIYDANNTANRVTIFDGPDDGFPTFESTTLSFDLVTGAWSNDFFVTSTVFGYGATFGFGLDSSAEADGGVFFSQSGLNADGIDYMLSFATEGLDGLIGAFDYTLAWEDLLGFATDRDFNDHVFGVTDVAPIPLPAGLVLILTAFGGLAVVGRRRREVTAA